MNTDTLNLLDKDVRLMIRITYEFYVKLAITYKESGEKQ